MRLYLKFYFDSEGRNPLEIVRELAEIGFTPEVGEYDASIGFTKPEEYEKIVNKLHEKLRGSKVLYTLTSHERIIGY